MPNELSNGRLPENVYDIIDKNIPKPYAGCVFINPDDKIFLARRERDKVPNYWFMDAIWKLNHEHAIDCILDQLIDKFDIKINKENVNDRKFKLIPGTFIIKEKTGGKRIVKLYTLKVDPKEEEKINSNLKKTYDSDKSKWVYPGSILREKGYDKNLKIIADRIINLGRLRDLLHDTPDWELRDAVRKILAIYDMPNLTFEEKYSFKK